VRLKKRDFEGGLAKLRRAAELDPNGDVLAALAWALVADPKASPKAKEEAASLINRALRAPGVTARTYYVAGVLWRTKDPESSADAFKKALEADPRHADAALELRLIEQRRGKNPQKPGGGVLSELLFGKRKG
jgi:tetratricopeptide (TPR) repeat protein